VFYENLIKHSAYVVVIVCIVMAIPEKLGKPDDTQDLGVIPGALEPENALGFTRDDVVKCQSKIKLESTGVTNY